jgi:hypothetical protein
MVLLNRPTGNPSQNLKYAMRSSTASQKQVAQLQVEASGSSGSRYDCCASKMSHWLPLITGGSNLVVQFGGSLIGKSLWAIGVLRAGRQLDPMTAQRGLHVEISGRGHGRPWFSQTSEFIVVNTNAFASTNYMFKLLRIELSGWGQGRPWCFKVLLTHYNSNELEVLRFQSKGDCGYGFTQHSQ